MEELKRGDLAGITHLEELTVHANNLRRYLFSDLQETAEPCPSNISRCSPVMLQVRVRCFSHHLATRQSDSEPPRSIFNK